MIAFFIVVGYWYLMRFHRLYLYLHMFLNYFCLFNFILILSSTPFPTTPFFLFRKNPVFFLTLRVCCWSCAISIVSTIFASRNEWKTSWKKNYNEKKRETIFGTIMSQIVLCVTCVWHYNMRYVYSIKVVHVQKNSLHVVQCTYLNCLLFVVEAAVIIVHNVSRAVNTGIRASIT